MPGSEQYVSPGHGTGPTTPSRVITEVLAIACIERINPEGDSGTVDRGYAEPTSLIARFRTPAEQQEVPFLGLNHARPLIVQPRVKVVESRTERLDLALERRSAQKHESG